MELRRGAAGSPGDSLATRTRSALRSIRDLVVGAPAAELYFTAGPDHGTGGLFGYLKPVSTELIKGNDQ